MRPPPGGDIYREGKGWIFLNKSEPEAEKPCSRSANENGATEPMFIKQPCHVLKRWVAPMQFLRDFNLQRDCFPCLLARKYHEAAATRPGLLKVFVDSVELFAKLFSRRCWQFIVECLPS